MTTPHAKAAALIEDQARIQHAWAAMFAQAGQSDRAAAEREAARILDRTAAVLRRAGSAALPERERAA